FSKEDLNKLSGGTIEAPELPAATDMDRALVAKGEWPQYAPPLMRAQLMQFPKGSVDRDKFSEPGSEYAKTLFLYPFAGAGSTSDFGIDLRRASAAQNKPQPAQCATDFNQFNGYACRVDVALPSMSGREAYLQLQAIYQN